MKYEIRQCHKKEQLLWMTDGHTDLAVSLDYGIRIIHLSCAGMDNLLYEQPEDLSDGLITDKGWRIFGGHRLWAAPESDKSYYPDQDPVSYELFENGVILTQEIDPWLNIKKQLRIEFCEDGSLLLKHRIENTSSVPCTFGSWGVTTFASDSNAEIWFDGGLEGYNPKRKISLWGMTDLSDPRLRFTSDRIYAKQLPNSSELKIGIFSYSGHAELTAKNQCFQMDFEADTAKTYPDDGCNFELYTDSFVLELEALGQLCTLEQGQAATHWERWHVIKI